MKKVFIILLALMCAGVLFGQDKKVAVFDPAGSVENTIKDIIREEISSIIVNTNGYTVLERQLIDKVLEENKFQMSGMVDDSQISAVGKLLGANLVLVSNVTMLGNNFYISCKLIEVQSARIDMQKTAQTQNGSNDLVTIVRALVKQMLVQQTATQSNNRQFSGTGMLVNTGVKVFMDGRRLNRNEVKGMMVNTDAFKFYEKGVSQNKTGNALLITGTATMGILMGAMVAIDVAVIGDGELYFFIAAGIPAGVSSLLALGIPGIVLKSKGKKNIAKSVEMYNRRNYVSSIYPEFKVGFTGNGVGLVVNF